MADFISRDYALHNIEFGLWDTETDRNRAIHYVRELTPAADVRPVVLCLDCKWFGEKKDSLRGCCALLGIYPAKDWYCAFGTRLTNCGAEMITGKEENGRT